MNAIILLIRVTGQTDFVDTFPSQDAARARLVAFVRDQPARGGGDHAADDEQAIADWFAPDDAVYVITQLKIGA